MTKHDLSDLGALVHRERLRWGLSIDEAADRAGMSAVTWSRIEKGLPVRALTYAGVERVLRWDPGDSKEFLAAGKPPGQTRIPLDGVGPKDSNPGGGEDPLIAEIWADPSLSEDVKMQLEQIVRRANADREMVEERLRRAGRRTG